MFERFIDWTLSHNLLLIECLISLIFLSGFFLVLREMYARKTSKKNGQKSDGASLEEIQQALKDVLGNAESKSQMHNTRGDGPSPATAPLTEEIQLLRQALADKDAELQKAAAAAPVADGAAPSSAPANDEELKLLQKQIADLKAKLQEYDIISEDIADLTKFKTENEKLRAELSQVKSSKGAAVPDQEAPVEVASADIAPTDVVPTDVTATEAPPPAENAEKAS